MTPAQESKEIDLEDVVPSFCNAYSSELRGTLLPFAPEVYLLAKIGGSRRVAAHFSEMLGRPLSRKPVLDLLAKIHKGEITITREEILEAAKKHPLAARFMARAPWLSDPKTLKAVVPEPPKKPVGRPQGTKTTKPGAAKPKITLSPAAPTPADTVNPPNKYGPKATPAMIAAYERIEKGLPD